MKAIDFHDGNSAPWLAFGLGTVHRAGDTTVVAQLALSNGFTHLDSAKAYDNEEYLGKAIAASGIPRSKLFVTTKLWSLEKDKGQTATSALKEQLAQLGLTYVDLLLIHSPRIHQGYPGRLKEVWKEMIDAKKQGLTKSIGVSNFNVGLLKEIMGEDSEVPVVNQVRRPVDLSCIAQPAVRACIL